MKAVRKAYDTNKQIAVFAQKDIETEDPDVSDLHFYRHLSQGT
jgi:hypothetical protein